MIEQKCAVIGYGSWATAIVKILCDSGCKVSWYIRNPEVLQALMAEGRNPKYLREVEFDTSMIVASDNIDEVVEQADTVVLVMPSAFVADFLAPLTVSLKGKTIVSAVKGIVPEIYLPVTEFMVSRYGVSVDDMVVITGPTHAEEVGMERLSYLTVVACDEQRAVQAGRLFSVPYLHISYSTDLQGVEYAVIMKNIYAIAAGLAVGAGYGDNFMAVLITGCASEMRRFLDSSFPQQRDVMTAPYLGDLLVTSTSTFSRNRRLGILIGHGCSVKSALNEMTMVAEGYYAAYCLRHTAFADRCDTPIADMVYNVLYNNASARRELKTLSNILH